MLKSKEQKYIYAVRDRVLQHGKGGKPEVALIGSISENFVLAIAGELHQQAKEGLLVQQEKTKFGQHLCSFEVKGTIKIIPENVLVSFPITCVQEEGKIILTEEQIKKFILQFNTLLEQDNSDDSQYSRYTDSIQQISPIDHRCRGRPKGSKNRRKESIQKSSEQEFVDESNKKTQEKRGRGRPKGAKNIKKQQTMAVQNTLSDMNIFKLFQKLFETKSIEEVNTKINRLKDRDQRLTTVKKEQFEGEEMIKRSRGRPKGVKNKPKLNNQDSESEQTQQLQSLPKRKHLKGYTFGRCCTKCHQKDLKKHFLQGKDVSIDQLTNLCQNYTVENHGNVILTALKAGELKVIRDVLERRDVRDNVFAVSWDGTSRLEELYHTVRTKKELIAKGKREGIHALIQDCYKSSETIWWKMIGLSRILACLPHGPKSIQIYSLLIQVQPELKKQFFLNISTLVRCGNQTLSSYLFEQVLKQQQNLTLYGYSPLHAQVLSKRKSELQFKKVTMAKQSYTVNFCSPIHCAVINSNTELLGFILKHVTDLSVGDSLGRKPIHYAAVLESTKQLEMLVKAGADLKELDKKKCTPLMLAARFGRHKNVKYILDKVRDPHYLNFKGDQGLAALHYAVIQKHHECIMALIDDNLVQKQVQTKQGMNIFHICCANGQKDILKILLQRGYLPQPDNYRRTPLMMAIRNYQNECFLHLFSNVNRYYKRDYSYNTLLHYAAAYGNLQIVKYLQDIGIRQAMNRKRFYPFQIAVLKGHYQCAKMLQNWTLHYSHHLLQRLAKNPRGTEQFYQMFEYLLQTKKYDINYQNPMAGKFTCFHFICSMSEHQYYRVRRLETSQVRPNQYQEMQFKLISMLKEYGCDPELQNERGEKPLKLCIQNQNLVGIQLLLKDIPFELQPVRSYSYIYYLTKIGCLGWSEMQFVYQKLKNTEERILKAELRKVDANGFQFLIYLVKKFTECVHSNFRTAFGKAKEQGKTEKQAVIEGFEQYLQHEEWFIKTVGFLVDMGADPKFTVSEPRMDEEYENYKKWGIQHFLMRFPSPNLLRIFMKWIDTNFNLQNSEGRTPLHLFCMWNSEGNIFNQPQDGLPLIDYPEMKQFQGKRCMQYLLQNGLTSNVLDINRSTPLLEAALRGQLGFIKLLRNFGSTINNVNSLNQMPLIEIIRQKNNFSLEEIETVLSDEGLRADFNDSNGRNALHHLVSVAKNFDNSPEICRKLLEYGVSVNSLDKYGRSPIFYCFIRIEQNQSSHDDSNDKVEILQTLLAQSDTDINIIDMYHRTPLHYACEKKFFFSILYLLEKQRHYDVKDAEGNTPLAICLKNRNLSQAAMLIKKGVTLGKVVEEGEELSYVEYALKYFPVGICFMLIDHGYPLEQALKEAHSFRDILVKKYGQ